MVNYLGHVCQQSMSHLLKGLERQRTQRGKGGMNDRGAELHNNTSHFAKVSTSRRGSILGMRFTQTLGNMVGKV